ncbi:trihelix transcription factor GT-3a-like isoform X2 [Xiphophorus hellerii]|uniref:trihelix transcription factor GT-3a-like isoform X2 n=1 Tax=Xiphophorus hellerii TaxID=8084 RepID=UPI0013B41352|nr:trihelix transcription factor GT-3a-like isoform X2 [Xiphophorus hellerii]
MARGQTWSEEEVKALIKIWSDENVLQLLLTTHKNKQVFKLISGDMEALGFPRTAAQCRTKLKKLRQQYVKIRNMRRNNRSTDVAMEQFPWYDELDAMLGSLPTSSQYVLDSCKEEPLSPSSMELSDSESTAQDQDSEQRDGSAADIKVEETPITISLLDEERSRPKVTVPGAQKRKRDTKTEKFEKMFVSYLDEKKKLDEAECERMKQEQASFENFLKMQQQAEERRFQLMQEQQRANSKMFFQMMSDFLHAAMPQSMTQSTLQQSTAPPPVTPPLWPSAHTHHTDDSPLFNGHQQNTPGSPHTVLAPAQTPQGPNMATTQPVFNIF